MKKNKSGAIVACALSAIAFLTVAFSAAADEPQPRFIKNGIEKLPAQVRISRPLLGLEQQYANYLVSPDKGKKNFAPASALMRVSDGYVVVDAVAAGDADALRSDLLGLGAVDVAVRKSMVSARVPMTSLGALGSLNSLQFARPFYATTRVGATTSQGDVAQLSDELRSNTGFDGAGVKVGVLSDSYDCLGGAAADVTSLDLPAGVTVILEETGCASGSDEGRAMLQIVHDVAPGAALSFHTAFNGVAGFANGIDALVADIQATSGGVGVVVDDVLYFTEPMFQDGEIGQAADDAVLAGVPYYSAAGNSAADSYDSPFVDSGIPGVNGGAAHDFDPGPFVSVLQEIAVPVGGSFTMSFQWNQPFFSVSGAPGAATDLDIYIIGADGATLLAGGNDFNQGSDAVEVFEFFNAGFDLDGVAGLDTTFFVLIENFAGPNPSMLKYAYSGSGTIVDFDTASSTGYGHPNSKLSQAVGAAAYFETPEFGQTPPLPEGFTSRSGIPTFFTETGAAIDPPEYRPKPEITAPDGGNNTFFGSDFEGDNFPNFFGTSAAAPHAAGVAALLLSIDTARTPAIVNGGLRDGAVDMLAAGFDDDTGSGLIDADAANGKLANGAPDLDPIPSQRGVTGETLTFILDTTTNPDPEGDAISFDADNLPSFCSAPSNNGDGTGAISCTITASDNGRFGVVAIATDDSAQARTDIEGFYVIANENTAPVLANILPQSVDEGQQLVVPFSSTDPQGQSLTVSVNFAPSFCDPVDDNGDGTGSMTCNPGFTDSGSAGFYAVATDNGVPSMADSQFVPFNITDINRPPILTAIGNQNTDEGQQLVIPLSATDLDTDNSPTYGVTGLPGFCALNDNFDYTGDITCNPSSTDSGLYNLTITINDNAPAPLSDSEAIQLTVNNVSFAPVLDPIGDQGTSIGQVLVIPINATDADSVNLTIDTSGLPSFCTPTDLGDGTGDITCSPTVPAHIGTYPVSVTVTDDGMPSQQDSEAFDIVISDVNQAPVLDPINNLPVVMNENSVVLLNATDPDGNNLTLSATLPSYCGLVDNGSGSGQISCSPGINDSGIFNATVFADDDGVPSMQASQSFDIQVTDRFNEAPMLNAIGNQAGGEGSQLVIPLSASDDIANALSFSATGLPGFCDPLTDNGNGTGNITCNPTGIDAGTYPVTVTVTDDGTPWVPGSNTPPLTDSESFDIVIAPTALQEGDQDGDGKSDILLRNNATGANFLYLMDGTTITQGLSVTTVSTDWEVVGRGDYTGDGKADILWRFMPTGAIWIFQMNGSTVSASLFVATVSDPDWKVVGNGDYNGDGMSDILWHHQTNGTVWLYQMNGNTIATSSGIGVVPDTDWKIFGSGDYNGDGKSDILWRNGVSGTNWMYLMNGASITTSIGVSVTPDLNWEIVGSGDYDGDFKSDILWRNAASGTNWLYLMNGTTIASSGSISVLPDLNWIVVGDGDYNDDGMSDVLWRNLSTGSNFMYLMNGFTITTNANVSTVTDQNWQIANPN